MINSYIETNKISTTKKNKSNNKEIDTKIPNNQIISPVTYLIEKLENCKNRNERKRLLSEFNKNVGLAWGEYKKVPKKIESNFDEDEINFTNDPEKEKRILEREMSIKKIASDYSKKSSNNLNTMNLTEKKIRKIANDSEKLNNISKKFLHKINLKNQKTKALTNQKNLSLLLNDDSADRTYVKIPGKDYGKALKYLTESENKNAKEIFGGLIEEKKKDYSVDIRKYVDSKKNKVDKKIDIAKRVTLLQLEQAGEIKEIENDQNFNKKILLNFESKVNTGNLLLENEGNYKIDYLGTVDSSKNKNEIEEFKFDNNNVNEISSFYDTKVDHINFRKINLMKKDEKNIQIFKQENELVKETIKNKQNISKIKKVIKNKHIYQSQNYYKNNELEDVAYERDASFMRSQKYKHAIKKNKYEYTKK